MLSCQLFRRRNFRSIELDKCAVTHVAPHIGPSPSQRLKPYNPRLRVRIWPLTFWPKDQCIPRSCHGLPTLVLIAQAVFFFELEVNRQTHRRDWTTYPTPAATQPAWVTNKRYAWEKEHLTCRHATMCMCPSIVCQ